MKTLILAAIRCLLMFTAVTASLFSVQSAQAFTMTMEQMGSNVVVTGTGAINLTGLNFRGSGDFIDTGVQANRALIGNLGMQLRFMDDYMGYIGPTNFGHGGFFAPDTTSGDFVALFGSVGFLLVPHSYVSRTALSNSMTFNNATVASLGVRPGTYEWTWGDGANQNFTLIIIGWAEVPAGGSTISLLGCALLGLVALRPRLSC
jgi:hypothetical protein